MSDFDLHKVSNLKGLHQWDTAQEHAPTLPPCLSTTRGSVAERCGASIPFMLCLEHNPALLKQVLLNRGAAEEEGRGGVEEGVVVSEGEMDGR